MARPRTASPPAVRGRISAGRAERTAGARPKTPAQGWWRTRLTDPRPWAGERLARLAVRLLSDGGPARWP